MKLDSDHRCLIIPFCWWDKASEGIARLNQTRPCYSLVPWEQPSEPEIFPKALDLATQDLHQQGALLVLPKSFGKAEKIPFWPKLIQRGSRNYWICSLFFADFWEEVEQYLQGFCIELETEPIDLQVSCQYELPYTDMLELWAKAGAKPFHPGDYFKEDFLLELKKMKGFWAYWGHAEGDRLRGYGHLLTNEILSNSPETPLVLTLWFTCSTLDPEVKENIGLSWFLSGKTQCLLASPYKVKTEENQFLGRAFLMAFTQKNHQILSEILFRMLAKNDQSIFNVLNQYYLLGSPWVEMSKPLLQAK